VSFDRSTDGQWCVGPVDHPHLDQAEALEQAPIYGAQESCWLGGIVPPVACLKSDATPEADNRESNSPGPSTPTGSLLTSSDVDAGDDQADVAPEKADGETRRAQPDQYA
jgi:hypothetical protein